jgi:hypothetical protein
LHITNFVGRVHLENHCASLVAKLNQKGAKSASNVEDIKKHLWLFANLNYTKVNRARNLVAHELAKLGRNATFGHVLRGSVPLNAVELIKNECNTLNGS